MVVDFRQYFNGAREKYKKSVAELMLSLSLAKNVPICGVPFLYTLQAL